MEPFTIAVLSDLHIGTEARAKDLCPHDGEGPAIDDNYRKCFLRFLDDQKISADYLVLPGDVTNKAKLAEVELASEIVTEIREALGVRKSKTLFVPGNHDVDWEVLKLGADRVRREQRYDPLSDQQCVFKNLMHRKDGHVLREPYVSVKAFDDFVFVGYNSSWDDDPEKALHFGIIDESHVQELAERLNEMGDALLSPDKLRVFLVHHHPVAHSQLIPGDPDFSQMINGDKLLRVLTDKSFDLAIHGHKHQPRLQTQALEGNLPIVIFSAGSFSVKLPREWEGRVNNQFHLIRIDGRDGETGCVLGRVESWTYYPAHKWKPSTEEKEGVAHVEPFGVYYPPGELKNTLRPELVKFFKARSYLEWSDLFGITPSLKYVRPQRVIDVLKQLADELDFLVHKATPDELMLLKRENANG